jgi:head-tail adaptor
MQIRRQSIDPGALRHLITVQLKTVPEDLDKFGAPQEVWTTVTSVYAAYQPLGSREFQEKWKMVAETNARFLMRYRTDLDVAVNRILYNGLTFDVTDLTEADDRNMYLYVEVRQVV